MSNAMKYLVILVFIQTGYVSSTKVDNCTNIRPALSVKIKDCEVPPCELPQRSNAEMDIIFEVEQYHRQLSPNVLATVNGVVTPYPLNPDGCSALQNGYCPIVGGEVLEYHFELPISVLFPRVDVDLEFKLLGDDKQPITCFKVKCKVVAPRSGEAAPQIEYVE